MVCIKFAPLVLATALLASDVTAARVDPAVHRTLRQQGTVNLIVTMQKGTEDTINSIKEASFTSRGALIEDMVNRLQQHAEDTQTEVNSLFAKEGAGDFVDSKSFWITNQVYVEGATIDFLQRLAAMPSVESIHEEEVYEIPEVETTPVNATDVTGRSLAASAASLEWGVKMIKAPAVWELGFTGEGVIVGSIDSGVRGTHEALRDNFVGEYGWYDPEAKKTNPYDVTGHGTHTVGTIVGANGIGVAPGATWMACKGCRAKGAKGCPQSDLLACFQFMTCPTDTNGKNKDCSKTPHIVNNSWGGGQGTSTYKAAIRAWLAAGILPIFSNGNNGLNGCGTVTSPGDYDIVLSVGATTAGDGLAEFSSTGPSVGGVMKPDISAPGKDVRSASYVGDGAYELKSGTSMAAPHVTGATALLISAHEQGLSFDDLRTLLPNNADTQTLQASGHSCGGSRDGAFPNNMYGYGRLNVLSALKSLRK